MKWQPIDTAPKDGTWVFVACASRRPDEDSYPAAVARWGKGYSDSGAWVEQWCVDGNVDLGWWPDPTHWMPIPKLEVDDV